MRTIRSLMFIMLLMLIIGAGAAGAQNEVTEDLPPQILALQPYPGEEMPLDSPLTVIFNQAMNPQTVETAWSITPTIEGAFSWEDERTLVFTPANGWARESLYELEIGNSAKASNGLTLPDSYQATLRTVGRLLVNSVIPAENTEGIASDATITVAFNRPVVPMVSTVDMETLPQPLTIEPALSGNGEWLNTSIYQFIPDENLLGGATYTIKVNAGLMAVSGAALEEDFTWTFQTLAPEILNTDPWENSEIALDRSIYITFSQPMNQEATESAFRLLQQNGEPVIGTISWSANSDYLTFTPDEQLPIATTFQLIIDAEIAKGIGGAALRQGRDFTFHTVPRPYVQSTWPANGERDISPGYRQSMIRFGTPMNTDTFAGKIVISPEPDEWTPIVYGNTNLNMEFEFVPGTTYTITLLAGTEDIYGNAIPTDYTYSFTVGQVNDSIYLPDARRFIVTGAYRQDTVLSASIAGSPTVSFEVYSIPTEYVPQTFDYLYDDSLKALIENSSLVREWDETLSAETTYANIKIALASEQGGTLSPGTYLVVAVFNPDSVIQRFFNRGQNARVMPVAMAVANTNITVKRMQGDVLIWLTDMESGEPLVEHPATVYGRNGQIITSGYTDAEGVLRLSVTQSDFVMITSESEGRYGVWKSDWTPNPPSESLYFYTDRPIYRPGETLYFRGAYRDRDDFDYRVSNLQEVSVNISDNRGQMLLESKFELTELGTFSGELLLPDDAAIGWVSIYIEGNGRNLGSSSAQIAEFRVPEFSVEVTTSVDEIVAGEKIDTVINGKFYSGGVLSNGNVSWYANANQTSFNYTGPGRYSFSDYGSCSYYSYYCGYSSRSLASGSGTTDSSGNLLLEIENTIPDGPYPENVTIEATINDESGQYISGRTNVLIHPSDVYVGVRTDRYFGKENIPFTAEVITVSTDSEPVSGQTVQLTLIEKRWEREEIEGQFGRYNWTQTEIEVETVSVTSDELGTASYQFTAPNAGIFMIKATTRDQRERLHQSSIRMWVTGSTRVWWGEPTNTIDLIADKDIYVAGDTAQILVPISLEGTSWVLVSVERDGVVSYEVVRVEGSTLVYDLPIIEEYEPGISVSVMVMHGIDDENNVPTYRQGELQITVEPVHRRLNVTITPSTSNAQPGETVTFDIAVTDPDGNPVEAEFGLSLVDSAILSLANPNSIDPEMHYYGDFSNYTYTATMMMALVDGRLDDTFGEEQKSDDRADGDTMMRGAVTESEGLEMADMAAAPMAQDSLGFAAAGGGGGGFEEVTVREDFQQTPLWEAHVVTDANGHAQVSVVMPDNLTIWNLTARAITKDTLVAETQLDISSTIPLLVRPATPRFFVVGDEVSLAMVVNNNTDEVQSVNATILGEGFDLMDGEELEQTIEIAPNSRARFEWRVKIPDVKSVDLTFVAIGNDGYQDASRPPLATGPDGTIPVYRYTAPDTVGTGGVLREAGARTEGISIPPIADTDQGTLTIRVDPSLAVTTIDSLDYLWNYKHQCIEQTVSRFLPNVMTYRALKELNIDDPLLEANLRVSLDFALTKLSAGQNSDGGWGWFSGMDSNPVVTAYAVYGLIEAQEAGFDIDRTMIDRAVAFLRTTFINPTEDTETWRLNRQAFYFYVLTRDSAGRYAPSRAELDSLYRVRLEMNYDAKAYLLMAYNALNGDHSDQINALSSDLISGAKLSATGAHWEEDYHDWWNWSSDTRTTAIALSALLESDPDSELLPNAVRWLMVARRGDHWVTTQETSWSVMALTDWMVATNELQGNYDYAVVLNSVEQATGNVTPDTVREGRQLSIEVSELLLDEINRLTFIRGEGEGAMYYTSHLQLRLDANEVDAIDRGVGIVREYFAEGAETPTTNAKMGDILTVRLTITVAETIHFFVLEDPLPAGAEAMDTSLLTTTRGVKGPQIQPLHSPWYYWWWWYWDHTEIRDESVNLYADYLPPGTYVYSYQIQATTPGLFQTMPSHGYAFYFPEVFGRSDGELFTVEDGQ